MKLRFAIAFTMTIPIHSDLSLPSFDIKFCVTAFIHNPEGFVFNLHDLPLIVDSLCFFIVC